MSSMLSQVGFFVLFLRQNFGVLRTGHMLAPSYSILYKTVLVFFPRLGLPIMTPFYKQFLAGEQPYHSSPHKAQTDKYLIPKNKKGVTL